MTDSKALGPFSEREVLARRLRARVQRGGADECWIWQGGRAGWGRQRRYGLVTGGVYAHRAAWIVAHGAIPPGAQVLHRCDVPLCCNPSHLFLGTQDDNMKDAAVKGRLRVPRLRTRGFKQEVIARYRAGGLSAAALGALYGIHMMTVLRWVHAAGCGDMRPERSGGRAEANHADLG